jgi:tetratricopeptide (TPR) repeat protein
LIGYWTVGDVPPIPTESQVDAAHVFLGSSAERIASDFDTEWDEQAGREWKTRHEHFQQSKKRVQELHEKREKEDLSLEELMEIAEKIADTQGLADAYPILKEAAEKFPNEANVWYSLGSVRLTLDDEAGLADLERAAEIDSKYKLAANDTAFAYLRSKGRVDEAKEKASYLEEQNEIFEKADRERAAVYPNDQFEVHELPAEFIDQIPKKLGGLEEITAIYAVRKVVQYLPEYPYQVLFIEVRKKGRFRNRHDADPSAILKIVVDRLSTGEIQYFALLNGKFAGVKHYLDRIPGAKIYPKA